MQLIGKATLAKLTLGYDELRRQFDVLLSTFPWTRMHREDGIQSDAGRATLEYRALLLDDLTSLPFSIGRNLQRSEFVC